MKRVGVPTTAPAEQPLYAWQCVVPQCGLVTLTGFDQIEAFRPLTALVVQAGAARDAVIVTALAAAGFAVVTASGFDAAKAHLANTPPTLLVTDVKLASFNGLHLVLRARGTQPPVASIVIHDVFDPVLQRDAESLGATFMVRPMSERDLLAASARAISQREGDPPIRPPFERRLSERRTVLVTNVVERRVRDRRRAFALLAH